MATYIINNKELKYKEQEIPVSNLNFYPKNPRVFSVLNEDQLQDPDQSTIFDHMKKMEHVKALSQNIKMNGGLINPILVSDNVVIEGNSRLAAYKILQTKDPIKWGKIRCHVFEVSLTEDDIFNLLCTFHVNGRKDWNPMEQAGLLYRRQRECMRPIEEIAKERGMKAAEAKHMVATFEIMRENDDIEQSKWSYYEEFRKIESDVKKSEDRFPEYEVRKAILDRIKDETIGESKDLRQIGKILKIDEPQAKKVFESFLKNEVDIDSFSDVINNTDVLENAKKKANQLRILLTDDVIKTLVQDDELAFSLRKIRTIISNLGI